MRISDYLAEPLPKREVFFAMHPHAVLLHYSLEEANTQSGFETVMDKSHDRTSAAACRIEPRDDLYVIPVRKRQENVFSERISVGRTRTNDIRLPFAKISKFHAYFGKDESGAYTLTDAASTNGTTVAGITLLPRKTVKLSNRVVICFAHFRFRFHELAGFYDLLSELEQQGA